MTVVRLAQCHECKVTVLALPGICDNCAQRIRESEATMRLARAVDSIHPSSRWCRFGSGLMRERVAPLRWRTSICGETVAQAEGYESLRDQLLLYTQIVTPQTSRIVITGKESGVGKTSIAVAMMLDGIDRAHRILSSGETSAETVFAEQSRMVAAIDLSDPHHERTAHSASLLVLDDAGQERRAGGFRSADAAMLTGNLLDRRARTSRMTIVTTPGTREEWGEWYGGRIVRLYWDMPNAVVLEMRTE